MTVYALSSATQDAKFKSFCSNQQGVLSKCRCGASNPWLGSECHAEDRCDSSVVRYTGPIFETGHTLEGACSSLTTLLDVHSKVMERSHVVSWTTREPFQGCWSKSDEKDLQHTTQLVLDICESTVLLNTRIGELGGCTAVCAASCQLGPASCIVYQL